MAKTRIAIAVAAATALAALTAAPAPAAGEGKPKLRTLSTRADLVTGGDVLVAVDVPRAADAGKVRVRRNGVDVTAAFAPAAGDPKRLVGLVDGLRDGDNLLTASVRGSSRAASLGVFNSPVTGPVFSGPLQAPFFCRTADQGLGPPTDGNCSAPEQVAWYYRTTNGSFKPLANPAGPLPADGVETTTRDGRTVDYVVRVESGVIDRSIYRFAVLAPGGIPADGWNRRFVFNFGGGCAAGYEQGGRPIGTALNNPELSQGYATLTGSLNVLGTACNDVLSAEAAQMLKEHAIEALGERPVWTMGQGGSGGSVQQQLIAQNYPGILDGLMPGASFPDGASPDYPDCRLLNAYFATPGGAALSAAQRRAVTGLADADGCLALGAGADVVNAGEGCNESVVPPAQIFDPVTNPDGIRCTVWDSMVNVYGRDPATGHARRTLDNVGVQYGLGALNDGAIGIGAFLDLNEGIGGYDDDGEIRAQRSVADPEALATAYRTGRVNRTLGGYRDVPVLDIRSYVDDEINVHQYINTYRLRARLDAAGGHENQVMWRAKGGPNVNAMNDAALTTLADWMDAIAADDSDRSAAEKVVAAKPADAVDACWIGGQRTNGEARIGAANVCETTYAPHALPADVAGRPLASTVLKCTLKPIDYGDYDVSFDQAQRDRLEAAFPDGVCDWSKPGVGQEAFAGTWQEFGPAREAKKRKRSIALSLNRSGGTLGAQAGVRPCPATAGQPIRFERKGGSGGWKRFGSAVVSGPRCRAKAKLRVRRSAHVRIRAVAEAVYGYRGAKSKVRRG